MKKNPPDLQNLARSVAAYLKSLPGMMFAFPVILQRTGKHRGGPWAGALYFQRNEVPRQSGAPASGSKYIAAALYMVGVPPNVRIGKGFAGKVYAATRKTAYRLTGDVSRLGGWAKRDWYLGTYYSPAAVASKEHVQFKRYHPFGATFMLMPWRVPSGEPIDLYERQPYQRETLFLSLLDGAKSNPADKNVIAFFRAHAGSSYDPKKETEAQGRENMARQMAAAEAWASRKGYSFEWQIDPDIDSSDFSDEKPAWQLWQVAMRDPAGRVVESLGGVDFGRDGEPWGNDYRRVVEAELAVVHRIPVKGNPYAAEHAARLVKPSGFVRVRRHNNEFGAGISAVYGIRRKAGPRGGRTILQAIRFDAGRFTPAQARAWLRRNAKYRVLKFEPARGPQVRRHDRHASLPRGSARRNPQAAPSDPTAAHELVLYITNDGTLYRQQTQPIIANLAKKMKQGRYDPALAVKLWTYLADNGAKRYAREFSSPGDEKMIFTPATRRLAAVELRDHYLESVQRAAGAWQSVKANRGRRRATARGHKRPHGGWILCYAGKVGRDLYVSSLTRHKVRLVKERARAHRFVRTVAQRWVRWLNTKHRGRFRAERY